MGAVKIGERSAGIVVRKSMPKINVDTEAQFIRAMTDIGCRFESNIKQGKDYFVFDLPDGSIMCTWFAGEYGVDFGELCLANAKILIARIAKR